MQAFWNRTSEKKSRLTYLVFQKRSAVTPQSAVDAADRKLQTNLSGTRNAHFHSLEFFHDLLSSPLHETGDQVE